MQFSPLLGLFFGQYFWENDSGEVHIVLQGEGSEQGDAMMPLLFSLGQHAALEDVSRTWMTSMWCQNLGG